MLVQVIGGDIISSWTFNCVWSISRYCYIYSINIIAQRWSTLLPVHGPKFSSMQRKTMHRTISPLKVNNTSLFQTNSNVGVSRKPLIIRLICNKLSLRPILVVRDSEHRIPPSACFASMSCLLLLRDHGPWKKNGMKKRVNDIGERRLPLRS